jgi:hypothetical protein
VLPFSGGTVHSANWSGYAVRSKRHAISAVSSTFVVPKVSNLDLGLAVTWAGIGGFQTKDLIQAGALEGGQFFGSPRYEAWYELLPAGLTQIHNCKGSPRCKVSPGDHMSVNIHSVARATWSIFIRDQGHWSWSKTVHYNSSRSSAEWILEVPSPAPKLAHAGTVHFGPTSRFTARGASHTIGQGHPIRIILDGGQATPSALAADRQSFNDCSYKSRCSRP